MKGLRSRRLAVAIMASVAILLPLELGVMNAQAAPGRPAVSAPSAKRPVPKVQPDFTCPNPGVCVFDGDSFNNDVVVIDPATEGGSWLSLTGLGLTLPWGSFNNNSGSSVVFGDQAQQIKCFGPGTRLDAAQIDSIASWIRLARYVFVEFGNTTCSGSHPKVP